MAPAIAAGNTLVLKTATFTPLTAVLLCQVLEEGGVIINDTPSFRADHMPYSGNRQSSLGREGVCYAMEEMTNIQMVAIRLG